MRSVFLVETSKRKLALGRSPCYSLPVSNTTTTTEPLMTANAKAKNKVAEQIAKDAAKPKGPTLAQFALKPRPLMRGGRDVS
jgi:hypothetical protein